MVCDFQCIWAKDIDNAFTPAEKWQNFSMGYREFLFQLFEDNLVLLEGT